MTRRSLPFDYAVRNLGRRRLRTVLTGASSALVAALLVATSSFARGMDSSFAGAAQEDVVILLSRVAEEDVLRSTVAMAVPELVSAAVPGVIAASPEIHMGTNLRIGDDERVHEALVRGVTERAFLVHEAVTIVSGEPPGPGEVLVGRLVPAKLGVPDEALARGSRARFEGGTFTVSGTFAAPGTTIESEVWAPLQELKGLARRDDLSAVFVRCASPRTQAELDLFAKRRLDLELNAIPSSLYYKELAAYFAPIRAVAWVLALLMAGAALFGGANTLNAAVQDRMRELATLRALGYPGIALVRSLLQESLVLAAAGGLLGLALARFALSGEAVRIAMSAFTLRVDPASVLVGFVGVVLIGALGALPAALRVLRLPIATALKEA